MTCIIVFFDTQWHNYYLLLHDHICCCLLHRETDITSLLTGISPVLAGQIEELTLSKVSINSGCVEVLIHSLTSPHSCLLKLWLFGCTISSSDYCHLTTAIPTSNLTHFTKEAMNHSSVKKLKIGDVSKDAVVVFLPNRQGGGRVLWVLNFVISIFAQNHIMHVFSTSFCTF